MQLAYLACLCLGVSLIFLKVYVCLYIDYRLYMYTCIRADIGAKRPQSVLLRIRAHVSNHVIQYIAVFEATNRINMHLKGTHTESTGSCSDRAHTELTQSSHRVPSGSKRLIFGHSGAHLEELLFSCGLAFVYGKRCQVNVIT